MKRFSGGGADTDTHRHSHRRPSLSNAPFLPAVFLQGSATGTGMGAASVGGTAVHSSGHGHLHAAVSMPG